MVSCVATEAYMVVAVGAMVMLWPVTGRLGWVLTMGVLCGWVCC